MNSIDFNLAGISDHALYQLADLERRRIAIDWDVLQYVSAHPELNVKLCIQIPSECRAFAIKLKSAYPDEVGGAKEGSGISLDRPENVDPCISMFIVRPTLYQAICNRGLAKKQWLFQECIGIVNQVDGQPQECRLFTVNMFQFNEAYREPFEGYWYFVAYAYADSYDIPVVRESTGCVTPAPRRFDIGLGDLWIVGFDLKKVLQGLGGELSPRGFATTHTLVSCAAN